MRRRVLAGICGLAAALLLIEAGLRVAGFSHPRISQRDDYVGTIRRPGVEVVSQEGGVRARFNSAGFRDEEWSIEKPPNTFRIAVLGASYVEAAGVALEDRFTEVLERELRRSETVGGRNVHVMTFALAGWSTAQALMCLRHHVWQYSPDMVILTVTTTDVRRNSKTLQNDDGRPYFTLSNGALTLDASFRESPSHGSSWEEDLALFIIDWSRAAQLAYRLWQVRASTAQQMRVGEAADAVRVGNEIGLDSWVYASPNHPVREEAWRITEALAALMRREVEEHGARFMVSTLSNGIQVHPDAAVRAEFMKPLGVADLFYPDRRLADAGAREGFAVVNLAPMLLAYAERTGTYVHGFGNRLGTGHWNRDGHREAGQRLADAARILLSTPGGPVAAHRVDGGSQ